MLLDRTLKSSTFRLAVFCVVLFSGAMFVLLGYAYWATAGYIGAQTDRAISADRAALIETYDRAGRDALIGLIDARMAERGSEGRIYLLADASLAFVAGNLKTWPEALRGDQGSAEFDAPESREAAARPLLRADFETLSDGSHLLVGRDVDDLGKVIGTMNTALALGAAFTVLLAVFAGISVTRRTVGRIEAINATTREIMQSGLGRRIPLRGTKDEWDQLAENLNTMLGRIEALVRDVRQVSDNIAHDLRTPLTRLRGRLEKAYLHECRAERYHDLVGDTIRDLDGVLRTFSSLLRISRIEALDPRRTFRLLDLAQIAAEVVEIFDAAAEEKGGRIKLLTQGESYASGDRDLLFDAIANLIDNAIKHGGAGEVLVEVANDNEGALLSVADHGPGIPAEEHGNVLKRFYRLERSRSSPGNGLGLSLVAAVAQLHGAAIGMIDNRPGLRFELRFPPGRQVELPRSLPEAAVAAPRSQWPPARHARMRRRR